MTNSNIQFAPATDIPIHDDSLDLTAELDPNNDPSSSLSTSATSQRIPSSDFVLRLSGRKGQLSMTDNGLRFFGPTSNLHLLSSIVWTRRPYSDLLQKGKTAVETAGLEYDVPLFKQKNLLSLFWTWHNPVFAIVDKKMFERDLDSFLNPSNNNNEPSVPPTPITIPTQTSTKYFSPALLNAMLALGSLLDDSYDGHPYHIKARILLNTEIEEPQITTVQAAALLGIYEAMSDRDALGWVYSGMAMRMAVDMGYNLDPKQWVEQGCLTQQEAQMRLKTFWGCFIAERMWSFCLGRPSSIRLNDVAVPRPSEDVKDPKDFKDAKDSEDTEAWVPYVGPDVELPTIWKEYTALGQVKLSNVYLVKLAEIMAEIQEVLFSCSEKYTQAMFWDFASKMHVKLTQWYTTLPPPLLCSPNSQKPVVAHIVLLHLQYHATVINLFKPFLHEGLNESMDEKPIKTEDSENSSKITDNTLKNTNTTNPSVLASIHAADLCRSAAFQISGLLNRYHHSWYSLRRIHPSAVQIAFSAATIHLNNAWNDIVGAEKINSTQALKTCCEALAIMGCSYEAAKRALSVITCLMNKGRYGFSGDGSSRQIKTGSATPNFLGNLTSGNNSRIGSRNVTPSQSHLNLTQMGSNLINNAMANSWKKQESKVRGGVGGGGERGIHISESIRAEESFTDHIPSAPGTTSDSKPSLDGNEAERLSLQTGFGNSNSNPTAYAQGPAFHNDFQNILTSLGNSSRDETPDPANINTSTAHNNNNSLVNTNINPNSNGDVDDTGFDLTKVYGDFANFVPLHDGFHTIPVAETTWKPSLQRKMNLNRMVGKFGSHDDGGSMGFLNSSENDVLFVNSGDNDSSNSKGIKNDDKIKSSNSENDPGSLDAFRYSDNLSQQSQHQQPNQQPSQQQQFHHQPPSFQNNYNFFSHPLGYNSTVPFFGADDFFLYAKNMRNGRHDGGDDADDNENSNDRNNGDGGSGNGGRGSGFGDGVGSYSLENVLEQHSNQNGIQQQRRGRRQSSKSSDNTGSVSGSLNDDNSDIDGGTGSGSGLGGESGLESGEGLYCLLEENPRAAQSISNRVLYEYNLNRAQLCLNQLNQLATNNPDESNNVNNNNNISININNSNGSNKSTNNNATDRGHVDNSASDPTTTDPVKPNDNSSNNSSNGNEDKHNTQKVLSDLLILTTPLGLSNSNNNKNSGTGTSVNVGNSSSRRGSLKNDDNNKHEKEIDGLGGSSARRMSTNLHANNNNDGNPNRPANAGSHQQSQNQNWQSSNSFSSSPHVLNTSLSSLIGYDPSSVSSPQSNFNGNNNVNNNSGHGNANNSAAVLHFLERLNAPINPELSGTNEWRNFFQAVKKNNFEL